MYQQQQALRWHLLDMVATFSEQPLYFAHANIQQPMAVSKPRLGWGGAASLRERHAREYFLEVIMTALQPLQVCERFSLQ